MAHPQGTEVNVDRLVNHHKKISTALTLLTSLRAISFESELQLLLGAFFDKDQLNVIRKRLAPEQIFSTLMDEALDYERELYFQAYWNILNEKGRKSFLHKTFHEAALQSYYIYEILETFSDALKRDIALHMEIESDMEVDRHINWIPKNERLDYFKRVMPCSNLYSYGIMNRENGVQKRIGKENEVITFAELEELVIFMEKKHGPASSFIKEVRTRFNETKRALELANPD